MLFVSVVIIVGFAKTPTSEFRVLVDASLSRIQFRLHRKPKSSQLIFVEFVVQQTVVDLVSRS